MDFAEEPPLRAELFNIEQLENHAKVIARSHQLAGGSRRDKLLPRLAENENVLVETYDLIAASADLDRRIEPAAEWLLDNFYLIKEQILAIRRLLPPSYSRELPCLANGPAASFPRVYGIALELILHVDGRVDELSLNSFIAAYQTVQSLKIGELWAIPLMFRLALIENLRRVVLRIADARRDRDLAAAWADRMIQIVEQNPTDLIIVLADMARANPDLSGAFISELTRHFHGQNPNFAFAKSWIEQRVMDQGLTIDELVRAEGQAQAADQVSIGNSITSLRFLGSHDWREFVEKHSLIEQTLRDDPAGIYTSMDFDTRNRYRHAVEGISRRSHFDEYEVARKAVLLAEEHTRVKPGEREAHVGYYLIDRGRPILEQFVQMRYSPTVMLDQLRRKFPLSCYLLLTSAVTFLSTFLFYLAIRHITVGWIPLTLFMAPAFICATQFGVTLVNWLMTKVLSPQHLPRMDYEHGIPPEYRTLVAIPTMLTSRNGIEHLLEGLELRFLANRDRYLHFGLLTDLTDAATEVCDKDAELIQIARDGIKRLNEQYAHVRNDIFYLFHRNRCWNEREGVWMGRERKRGKLSDLNAMLRGAKDRFAVVVGEYEILSSVRYVITLDTDTQLPWNAAIQMVGTLSHLLNQPVFNSQRSRVIDGYTILQPRVDVNLASSQRSRFSQLYSDNTGVDPYTHVVSDVYQDLFGEGSFIGKGIYDVDSFEHCCNNFPDNAILSHDLIEGAYARAALLSDVTLYEEFPARYLSDIDRRHRWIRGDWQIIQWLLPWVPTRTGKSIINPISILSRWKIFDNLRRSIVPIAMFGLLVGSWFVSWQMAMAALLFIVITLILPTLTSAFFEIFQKPVDLSIFTHIGSQLHSMGRPLTQYLMTLVFLPYEVNVNIDAIFRTIYRMGWSHRSLLEWKTASDSDRRTTGHLVDTIQRMIVSPIFAIGTLLLIWKCHPAVLPIASPFIIVWSISPVIAWWLSRTIAAPAPFLNQNQKRFLRKASRKTWRYFEEFVNEEDNWLPPDNIHLNPELVIATRTSPTNIGMALLSDLAAFDFGYCSASRLLIRTQHTFHTMSRLERYKGHFFNWYETRSLQAMLPRYVSTVDSGNLAGNLLVLRSGFMELTASNIMPPRLFNGLWDTLSVFLDVARKVPHIDIDVLRKIERQMDTLPEMPMTLSAADVLLTHLADVAAELITVTTADADYIWWANSYANACRDHQSDLRYLAPWLLLPAAPQGLWKNATNNQDESLTQLHTLLKQLDTAVTLPELAQLPVVIIPLFDRIFPTIDPNFKPWFLDLRAALMESSQNAATRIQELEDLASQSSQFADMDFSLLYDPKKELFTIGYNVAEWRLDNSYYDLLASEARLASYIVIAQGKFGQQHWFALGRLLTKTGSVTALLSWSGSMFEYLMPLLVMPAYENTLLDRTYKAAVGRQIEYGRQRGVPWGISESGYNLIDQHRTYQYRAFGVPGLGLKRGLDEELVIAPYASALALMVSPEAACRNLERLSADGQQGAYGFYEAVDYTPSRLPPGTNSVTVRQFMSHHEGMSLLSFAYVLLDKPMQRRFLSDQMLKSSELLLQERVPKSTSPVYPHANESRTTRHITTDPGNTMRVYLNPNSQTIETHLLSNDRYHVAVTNSGGGYSRWNGLAVTRWREDATRDNYGSFCFVRDLESGAVWSNTWQPTTQKSQRYEAIFTQSRAEFRRTDHQIETYTQISVSPEDDIELRRVTLTNRSSTVRTLDITSYAEVVLATQAQDEAHPAFSNLFVQTELVRSRHAIYCTRRPRSTEEQPPWLMHMMTVRGKAICESSFESDRMRFVGRQRTLAFPEAMKSKAPLSNTEGPVLDPIVSVRQTISLQPNESINVDIVTGVAESRIGVEAMTEKYSDSNLADRVFDLAWTHSQILLQQLSITEEDAQVYSHLSGSIIYASALHRAKANILIRNRRGQSGLWGYGISGDLPIMLVRIRSHDYIELVSQALQAHSYWRLKGLIVDLVIWNEDDSVYRQLLQDTISDLVAASPDLARVDRPGGVFIRRGEQMPEEDRVLMQTIARVVLMDDAGSLMEQAERRRITEVAVPYLKLNRLRTDVAAPVPPGQYHLAFFNGLGGFSQDGREYVINLAPGQTTPAPWSNVIANSEFGTVISEGGSAYTWAENSHEYRLTPWNNDPVSDTCGEAIYIRDEETGQFWSPSPLPARGTNSYTTRHGFGYSIFDHTEDGIFSELCIYVDTEAPVKFYKLKLTNRSGRTRHLSVTGYWELVLGDIRSKSLLHVVTESDPKSGAIIASNVFSHEFEDRVAFVNCSETTRSHTGDRSEFLGRNGNPINPSAMRKVRLSGRVGAGYDPCAAIQAPVTLIDGEERTITFTMGATRGMNEAISLAQRFRTVESAHRAIEGVWDFWSRTLGVIHLETPDAAVNFLANGWLVYQTLACRMWARSGFYQSGGAFGFRDQLQDAMALVHAQPLLLRQHLLVAAARQFREGDVQHWWHPPQGRGVRTRFSDDLLWLPLAMCRYVSMTGDTGVLDEKIPFLTARLLHDKEESNYDLPHISDETGTLYEHGVRAINHALKFGEHGLPLMGCGDWNDGMNLVGLHGKGESVWLAFFLFHILEQFAILARQHGDAALADQYTVEAGRLRGNIEEHGWDGEWYRRAYFDDGTPLGSAMNEECQIDAISQSWSILSGAGSYARKKEALASVNKRLVRSDDQLILLLDPPFDKSDLNPGYIKGYVPGVRENGGQYTHSAIWVIMATAATGDSKRAWELFNLINPINHGSTPEDISIYRVEPYVVAADVYGVAPHTSRGGWTWYTGSSGWMYRLITESLIGLHLESNQLSFKPCLPEEWKTFQIHYRYRETFYHITINNHSPHGKVHQLTLDDVHQPGEFLTLIDDRQDHHVIIDLQ
jgi:cellobiose phosphorylase